jgi:PAS domain S-box-containing protein
VRARARWGQWRAARRELGEQNDWAGLVPALVLLVALVALDVLTGHESVLTVAFVLAPFVSAFAGGRWATAVTAALALAATAAAGTWNNDFGSTDYWIRFALVTFGGAFACFAATSEAEARRSMRRFQLLNEVAGVADGSMPLARTLGAITEVVVPELADICMIDAIGDNRVERAAVRARGEDREEVERRLREREPSLPQGIVEGAPELEPRFIPEMDEESLRMLAHDGTDLEFLRSLAPTSTITVALISRGRRVGALTLIMRDPSRRTYQRQDVRFARVLADRVAVALDNAGLFSDLQSIERRMDSVMEVLDEAVVLHDRSGNALFANDAAARMFGFESPGEMLALTRESRRELFDIYDETGNPLEDERLAPIRAMRGEEPGSQTLRMILRRTGDELWLRARSQRVPGPDGKTLYVVTAFEDVTELKEAEFAQTLLARTGELLTISNDYAETVERLAELPVPQLADWCSIFAPRADGTLSQVALAHGDMERREIVDTILAEYPLYASDDTGVAQVLRSGEAIVLERIDPLLDRMARDEQHRKMLDQLRFGSVMIMPMVISGRVIGTINFVNDADRRPFDDFDRDLAERFAVRAAVALENARLASDRAEIASTLQRGLLPPPLPEIEGWSAAALYRPAGAENDVGGDFYDAFRLESGWMLVIGDVTGRGASAAAITAQARYTLRTAAAITSDPLVALTALNRALLSGVEPALCSVAAIALRDNTSHVAELVVAGHPPPLLVGPDRVAEASGTGPVLGAFADARWALDACRVEDGEQLVVFTDGVTEAMGPGGRFGDARLREKLLGTTSPGTAVQRVEAALEEFTAGTLNDDAAILAVTPAPTVPDPAGRGLVAELLAS